MIGGSGYTCAVERSRTLCWGGLPGRSFEQQVEESLAGPARDSRRPVLEPIVLTERSAAGVVAGAAPQIAAAKPLPRHSATNVSDLGSCSVREGSTIGCEFLRILQNVGCPEFALPVSAGPIVGMAVSQIHACVWTRLGAAFCMGYNSFAQLGESELVASRPRRVF